MNGAAASRTEPGLRGRRLALDALLFAAIGVLMALLGPYRTLDLPLALRLAYWIAAIMAGGVTAGVLDRLMEPHLANFWLRVAAVSLALVPLVTPLVFALNAALLGLPGRLSHVPELAAQVFVLGFLIVLLRALVWRRVVETRTLVVPPLPDAERAFRMRLSARHRFARLIALEAEDHYVRVHTDAGSELLSMRFADALAELALAHGYRLHRSWWAAAGAIEAVRWKRGTGEARLAGAIVAPVSRSYAAELKQAGWR